MSFPNWNSTANRNKKWARDKYNRYASNNNTYYNNKIKKEDKLKHKPYTIGQVKTIIKLAHKLGKPELLKEFKITNCYDAGLIIIKLKALNKVA